MGVTKPRRRAIVNLKARRSRQRLKQPRCAGCKRVLGGLQIANATRLTISCSDCDHENCFNVVDGRWLRALKDSDTEAVVGDERDQQVQRHHSLVSAYAKLGAMPDERLCGPLPCPVCDLAGTL